MTKRLIDIDDELLELARELADAETIKGTVEEALRKLVRIESTKRHIEDLEIAYDERSRNVGRAVWRRRQMLDVPITPEVMERSTDVAVLMAEAGLHRHAKPMDLIIATAAESADLTVLHYDCDFDHIASITGQPTVWVAPPGNLD